MGAPATSIYICAGVPLSPRYDHTFVFDSRAKQLEYFQTKVVKTFSNYTYLRKKWNIKVQATLAEADKWNYLYFHNGTISYENGTPTAHIEKDYFYFINDVQYINDSTVELQLEMDVMQTYHFERKFPPCFVERQHTMSDYRTDKWAEEDLDTGELKNPDTYVVTDLDELCILTLASINPNHFESTLTKPVEALGYSYNGVFSGLKVWASSGEHWNPVQQCLGYLSERGFLDGIIAMWMYPKALVQLGGENTWDDDVVFKVVNSCIDYGHLIDIPMWGVNIDGLKPKNNRTWQYPYNFLYCSNNAGGAAVYRYERFPTYYTDTCTFQIFGSVSPDANVLMKPSNYNGAPDNFDDGLMLGGFPSCAWNADIYKMWLAQNQNSHAFNNSQGQIKIAAGAVTGIAGAIGSLLMGNVGGAVSSVGAGVGMAYSGASQIAELMAQKKDMAIQPPQARGKFASTANITAGAQTFTFYRKCVTYEYACAIDDYFTMYGYKRNRILPPTQRNRDRFQYVKTVNCVCNGEIPRADADKIASIFDRGVTLWYDIENFMNYDLPNRPIMGGDGVWAEE